LLLQKSKDLLISQGILSEAELTSRYHILLEKYAKDLLIEGNTLRSLISNAVLPAAFTYRKELADSINAQKTAGVEAVPEKKILVALTKSSIELTEANEKLETLLVKIEGLHEEAQGEAAAKELTVAMEDVREKSDALEKQVADKYWPLPKYTELLF
ncbi:UNVERIFIED_CONTAM: hypothetical protein HDU68_000513, partial [Siphonaria sp. JEL0065]